MKTLFVTIQLLAVLCLSFPVQAQNWFSVIARKKAAGGGGPTADFAADFEETGTPSVGTWGTTGTVLWDSTAHSTLTGQAAELETSGDEFNIDSADVSEYWLTGAIELAGLPSTTTFYSGIRNTSASSICVFRINASGQVALYANGADTTYSSTFTISTSTKYYFKVHFLSSGTCELAVSTDTTFSTSSTDTASDFYTSKTGGSATAGQCYSRAPSNGADYWVDDWSGWTSDPGTTFIAP